MRPSGEKRFSTTVQWCHKAHMLLSECAMISCLMLNNFSTHHKCTGLELLIKQWPYFGLFREWGVWTVTFLFVYTSRICTSSNLLVNHLKQLQLFFLIVLTTMSLKWVWKISTANIFKFASNMVNHTYSDGVYTIKVDLRIKRELREKHLSWSHSILKVIYPSKCVATL